MIDRMRTIGGWLATILVAWTGDAAAQGLYWESTTTGIGTQPRSAQIYAVPRMIKIVQPDGHTVIVRGDEDKLFTIDTAAHTYHEINIAGLEGPAHDTPGQVDTLRTQTEQRIKNLPPEQRAMMEKMMPNLQAPAGKRAPVTVSRTDETKTINGYACTKYVAQQGDKILLVAWTTNEVKAFDGLREDWVKFQKRMSVLSRMSGVTAGGIADAYAAMQGFPIVTEMGPVKTEVTKVEVRTTPASEFQVPAGYTLEPLRH